MIGPCAMNYYIHNKNSYNSFNIILNKEKCIHSLLLLWCILQVTVIFKQLRTHLNMYIHKEKFLEIEEFFINTWTQTW